ncbi:uncharacterized protein LOC112342126 isoform X2 [Selaginella moellendorffii]|uniref:uncharacterized protein LOC112342126 isoform X2 n=1 Tax=Selaginella moellendorffii TaxID=88036 RepID=UPI000D1D073C|nr:uncharacterized protein LOC112342126 isoform X2 [Selaginella moellendorffii]|eukprot:XP_024519207.1 uncharacterized protein LOC112342126 isoform X2 [Selaginella moellendorffii]
MAKEIQDHQFQRLLQIFPVVRSRDYCEEDRPLSTQSLDKDENGTQGTTHGAFWVKVKTLAEPKLGKEGAERFCQAFRRVHEDLVFKKVAVESICKILKTWEPRIKSQ